MAFLVLFSALAILHTASSAPPLEWEGPIAKGSLLYAEKLEKDVFEKYMPYIGNGYVGTRIGDPSFFVAGVFTGRGRGGPEKLSGPPPSHRARIGTTMDYVIKDANYTAYALDMQQGVFLRRGKLGPDCTFEERFYAHLAVKNLLVYEIRGLTLPLVGSMKCQLDLTLRRGNLSRDIEFSSQKTPNKGIIVESGWINETELATSERVEVTVAYREIPPIVFVGKEPVRFVTAIRTSLEKLTHMKAVDQVVKDYKIAAHAKDLFAQHSGAWNATWRRGVEIQGNLTMARSVNASMYYILSGIREDWPFGQSPGSISTQSYNGHSFWDTETWMFPAVLPFHTGLAKSLLQYRSNRLAAALLNAKRLGYKGAAFPWESAFTGAEVCPMWAYPGCDHEIHINGDIAMALRQYYFMTWDDVWLAKVAWPMLQQICTFWESKMVVDAASGNYTAKGVTPPDESAGPFTNDSVYTNAIAAASMRFCLNVAARVNGTVPMPSSWAKIADRPFLPINKTLYAKGPVHPEYTGYGGQTINQADVALLQYPLNFPMPKDIALNDLDYYTSVTDPDGYYTGNSAYSIAYLAQGVREMADSQLQLAFLHMKGPFNVWTERADTDGHLNFVTGAGGYLQNYIYGYGGIRIVEEGLLLKPTSLPHGKKLILRNINYDNLKLTLTIDSEAKTLTVRLVEAASKSNGTSCFCGRTAEVWEISDESRMELKRDSRVGIPINKDRTFPLGKPLLLRVASSSYLPRLWYVFVILLIVGIVASFLFWWRRRSMRRGGSYKQMHDAGVELTSPEDGGIKEEEEEEEVVEGVVVDKVEEPAEENDLEKEGEHVANPFSLGSAGPPSGGEEEESSSDDDDDDSPFQLEVAEK